MLERDSIDSTPAATKDAALRERNTAPETERPIEKAEVRRVEDFQRTNQRIIMSKTGHTNIAFVGDDAKGWATVIFIIFVKNLKKQLTRERCKMKLE